jgi:hypothetical protein
MSTLHKSKTKFLHKSNNIFKNPKDAIFSPSSNSPQVKETTANKINEGEMQRMSLLPSGSNVFFDSM